MFGCLSPSRDLPNSISCNSDSFSVSELLSVNGMSYSSLKPGILTAIKTKHYLNKLTKQLTSHQLIN